MPILATYHRYGLWSISSGLEYDDNVSDENDGYGNGFVAIPAACAWFIIAAPEVASLIGLELTGLEGPLWRVRSSSNKGYLTRERWLFWGRRLHGLVVKEKISIVVRDQISKAIIAYDCVGILNEE